jgi:NAD-reducing hydrogenase small subunit
MPRVTLCANWLDACSGCEMSLLDIDELVVELVKHVQILSSPITDLKHPPVGGADIGLLSGAVSDNHQEEIVREMRERVKILIAVGDCAVTGGICTMRNFLKVDDVLRRAYVEAESIAKLFPQVKAVDQIVKVDFYLPGCPPPAKAYWFIVTELLAGRTPVLTDDLLTYD